MDKDWIRDQEMGVVVSKVNKRKGRTPSRIASEGERGHGEGEGPSGSEPEGALGSCLNGLMEVRMYGLVLEDGPAETPCDRTHS